MIEYVTLNELQAYTQEAITQANVDSVNIWLTSEGVAKASLGTQELYKAAGLLADADAQDQLYVNPRAPLVESEQVKAGDVSTSTSYFQPARRIKPVSVQKALILLGAYLPKPMGNVMLVGRL